ncbi:MAG: cytochrome c4 [Pseudomonadota bacterium]|nr:cytochrome c4 [Pseudomonadota bacterium]
MIMTGLLMMPILVWANSMPMTGGASLQKGQQIASQVCAACHGADGNSVVSIYPKLAGQHSDYLYRQLIDFKSGKRLNPIMNGMAATLTDAQMRALADYFSSQVVHPGVGHGHRLVSFGKLIYRAGDKDSGIPACMACHGPTGAGIPGEFPRLGAQHAAYIYAQLKAFSTGQRANDPNKMMRDIASRMSDAQMQAVAQYIAGLH